jgi:hypothetical protein
VSFDNNSISSFGQCKAYTTDSGALRTMDGGGHPTMFLLVLFCPRTGSGTWRVLAEMRELQAPARRTNAKCCPGPSMAAWRCLDSGGRRSEETLIGGPLLLLDGWTSSWGWRRLPLGAIDLVTCVSNLRSIGTNRYFVGWYHVPILYTCYRSLIALFAVSYFKLGKQIETYI